MTLANKEITHLHNLAEQVREISCSDINIERKKAWLAHHNLQGYRPMLLIEAHELIPLLNVDERLKCTSPEGRALERQLLYKIWRFTEIKDDAVVEPSYKIPWSVHAGGYGVDFKEDRGQSEYGGSSHWDPVIIDFDKDVDKLHYRSLSVDYEASEQKFETASKLLAGILDIKMRGSLWWTTGMTATLIKLVGMENFMMGMITVPDGIHKLMNFLRDDQLNFIQQAEDLGVLTLNNEDDYVGSGTLGYVSDLPGREIAVEERITPADMWVLSESQESVGVSPEMFEEFIFPYQLSIIERFGLTYYGCCEPLDNRWDIVKKIPNLRAVSVSPWCDQEYMADALKRDYVFCRKPNPTMISTEVFNEDTIENDIRNTLTIAGSCNLEIVMKDIHTLHGENWRAARWIEIARKACRDFFA